MTASLTLQIIGTVLSLSGITLNVLKKRICWIIYLIANSMWIWLYIKTELFFVVFLMFVYQGMSIWGWIKWGKNNK